MPPRTRSRVKATTENTSNLQNTPVLTASQAAGLAKQKPASRVLQDITEHFTPNASAIVPVSKSFSKHEELVNPGYPPTKSYAPERSFKRKPKLPTGNLAKRNQGHLQGDSETHRVVPPSAGCSSLPPSSPPSVSSKPGHLGYEGDISAEAEPVEEPAKSAPDGFKDHLLGIGTDDFAEDDFQFEVYRDIPEHDHPANLSDPFGFFAAERMLKTQRAEASAQEGLRSSFIYPDENMPINIPLVDDHPTPHPDGTDHPLQASSPLRTPPIPHKPRRKRKSIITHAPSGEEIFSPHTGSMPSTPSPSKPSALSARMLSDFERSLGDIPMNSPGLKEPQGVQGAGKTTRNGKPAKKKMRSSDESISPTALAKKLEALLPKRRTRTVVQGAPGSRRRAVKKDFEDSSDGEVFEDYPKPRSTKRKPASKPTSKKGSAATSARSTKGKRNQPQADSDEEEGLDVNKLEQERQARVEFFKKLENYKLTEENVYIV